MGANSSVMPKGVEHADDTPAAVQADGTQSGAAVSGNPTPQPNADEIRAQARAELLAELKAATGQDSIAALKAAREQAEAERLAELGKFKELAEARALELTQLRAERDGERIRNALLAAAADSIDPGTVETLLRGSASIDAQGVVTVDGKPAAAAVAALLKDKPHLAKPAAGQGSGAGAAAGGGVSTEPPKRADFSSEIDYHRAVAKHRAGLEG